MVPVVAVLGTVSWGRYVNQAGVRGVGCRYDTMASISRTACLEAPCKSNLSENKSLETLARAIKPRSRWHEHLPDYYGLEEGCHPASTPTRRCSTLHNNAVFAQADNTQHQPRPPSCSSKPSTLVGRALPTRRLGGSSTVVGRLAVRALILVGGVKDGIDTARSLPGEKALQNNTVVSIAPTHGPTGGHT